jgi:ubiquitin carboxyl-terminal hydrolase 10
MVQGRKVNGTRYRLFGDLPVSVCFYAHSPQVTSPTHAALYHHSLSVSGGHYTLDVLHLNIDTSTPPTKLRKGYIFIDDELVSDLRAEDVFGSGGVGKDETMRCTYL